MLRQFKTFCLRISSELISFFLFVSILDMLPYSRGIILDNANNYGIVKTETVFGFSPRTHGRYLNDSFNSSDPLEWIFANGSFERRALKVEVNTPRSPKNLNSEEKITNRESRSRKSNRKTKIKAKSVKKSERKGKGKKCIIKMYEHKHSKERKKKLGRRRHKHKIMKKKYMMPMILGILAAKSIIIPIALKALAFLSAKGLMMGFFSTVMASILSLKGMFEQKNQDRKDDTKTQVEIIQVPSKSEDHVYYDDHHRRHEFTPSEVVRDKNLIDGGIYGSGTNNDFITHNVDTHYR